MGLSLPPPPDPVGNYLPANRSGNLMWLAGVGSRQADGALISGQLGAELSVEQGYEAARRCALNLLARMKAELGDLDRVSRILKVVGMVNSAAGFAGAGPGGGRCVGPVREPLRRPGAAQPVSSGHGGAARQLRGHRKNA